MPKYDDAESFYNVLQFFIDKLDDMPTKNIARIKNMLNALNFCDIDKTNINQVRRNKGDLYYKKNINDEYGDYIVNQTLDYIIIPKKLGIKCGVVSVSKNKDGQEVISFSKGAFTNYARFITDLISEKVIYSKEIDSFIRVCERAYEVINESVFLADYSVDKKYHIDDFYKTFKELAKKHMTQNKNFTLQRFSIVGNDWLFNINKGEITKYDYVKGHLFTAYYPVNIEDIDIKTAREFINLVTDGEASKHNLSLLHAYVFMRKLNLIPPEKWFLMRDNGRTGKGLFMYTFDGVIKITAVNLDILGEGVGFEVQNEWRKFVNAELAHANESGEIGKKKLGALRKIATGETVSYRLQGQNSQMVQIRSPLVLDTNESVDLGDMLANTSRVVKLPFKNRGELTNEERHLLFEDYWNFIKPNGKFEATRIEASVSFLLASLMYFKNNEMQFDFKDAHLKEYVTADDFSETQKIVISVIREQGYILASDDILQKSLVADYGHSGLRVKKARDDMQKIGVKLNETMRFEGITAKVHKVGNEALFLYASELLKTG